MKKVFLMIAVVAAFAFTSCTPKASDSAATANDSISAVDTSSVDSIPGDTVIVDTVSVK